MDKEITCINNLLIKSNKPLTTADISRNIYKEYNIKLSKRIVKNYLWSYFRNLINYNPDNYTYILKNDTFLIDDIETIQVKNRPRAITTNMNGNKIQLEYDVNTSQDTLIKAIGLLNFKTNFTKKKYRSH